MSGDSQILPSRSFKHTDGQFDLPHATHALFHPADYQGSQPYTLAVARSGDTPGFGAGPMARTVALGGSDWSPRAAGASAEKPHLDVTPYPYQTSGARDVAVSKLMNVSGAGIDAGSPPVERTVVSSAADAVRPGEKPAVDIRFSDKANDPTTGADASGKQPTFRVSSDGKILDSQGQEVTKDIAFANGVPKQIVIQVDRPANFEQLSPDQQQARVADQQVKLNDFVANSLNPALRQATADATVPGADVRDTTKLLQPETASQLAALSDTAPRPLDKSPEPVVAPQGDYSPPERSASRRMNGRGGMQNDHHGSMPRSMADGFFPQGEAPQAGEKPESIARREMLAGAFNPDKEDPYGTMRRQADGHSIAVGRYGHSYNQFNNVMHRALGNAMKHWPASVMAELGDPPDWSKLSEILKEHPELMQGIQDSVAEQVKNGEVPKELGDKFANADSLGKFGSFVNKLRGDGTPPTKEELAQNFGKDAQEAMGRDTVDRGLRAGKSAGETALAQHLGIEPDQLTDQQKSDPRNREFVESADKLNALAMARQNDGPTRSKNPNDRIDWLAGKNGEAQAQVSDISPELGKQMANWAKNWAARNPETHDANGVGNCTRLARMLYAQMGVLKLPGMSGVEQGKFLANSGLFREVDKSEARAGDYAFRGWAHRRSASGANLGDGLVVTGSDGRNVYGVNGASNREFVVNTRGGYYTPEHYLRPTDKFYALMKQNAGKSQG